MLDPHCVGMEWIHVSVYVCVSLSTIRYKEKVSDILSKYCVSIYVCV